MNDRNSLLGFGHRDPKNSASNRVRFIGGENTKVKRVDETGFKGTDKLLTVSQRFFFTSAVHLKTEQALFAAYPWLEESNRHPGQ